MSSAFTHRPGYVGKGAAPEAWLRANWDLREAARGFTTPMLVNGANRSDLAIRFSKFQEQFDRPGSYIATPMEIVEFSSAFSRSLSSHDVLIPLLPLTPTSPINVTVLRQCARQWVTGGRNTGDMKDEHVTNMFYSSLQSTVYHVAGLTTKPEQEKWMYALLMLTEAAREWMVGNKSAMAITKALARTPGADDCIQRALATVFLSPYEDWETPFALELLELTTRRSLRHGLKGVGMGTGQIALFALVPLLRSITRCLLGAEDYLEILTAFNGTVQRLLTGYVKVATSDSKELTVRTLGVLARAVELELSDDLIRSMLTHICEHPEMCDSVPWADWGVVPHGPTLAFVANTDRYAVGPHKAYRATVTPNTTFAATVRSFKTVEWSAVQFPTEGVYTIAPNVLGIAEAAQGDSRGRELVANWRITFGDDILSTRCVGVSAAGMEYSPSTRRYNKRFDFNITEPVYVIVHRDRIEVGQNGRVVVEYERPTALDAASGRLPLLFGFKNMELYISYAALPEPKPLDLPPTALLAQLQKLAAASQ